MSAAVRIPTIFRTYTGGAAEVTAEGATLREVLTNLDGSYPGIAQRVLDDSGSLRRFVNLYINDDDVRFLDGLDSAVGAGASVSIIPAVTGGSS